MRGGYWTIARFRGAPIRLHWSILLGALMFGGLRWSPGFLIGYGVLIVVHELGHAWMVQRLGHRVQSVEVRAFGGECEWSGNASPFEEALIAWGGVCAQMILLAATYAARKLYGAPTSAFAWEIVSVFTFTNLWLAAINLIPVPPLDGARAWTIFAAYRERSSNVPYGSWRDRSPDVQRRWFDALAKRSPRPPRDVEFERELDEEAPLNDEARAAIDRLLRNLGDHSEGPSEKQRRN